MLLGQAQDSPLLVTVAAGAAALPTLLKLATVISDQVGLGTLLAALAGRQAALGRRWAVVHPAGAAAPAGAIGMAGARAWAAGRARPPSLPPCLPGLPPCLPA